MKRLDHIRRIIDERTDDEITIIPGFVYPDKLIKYVGDRSVQIHLKNESIIRYLMFLLKRGVSLNYYFTPKTMSLNGFR